MNDIIEKVARAICKEAGHTPGRVNGITNKPMWHDNVDEAKAAIAALLADSELSQIALLITATRNKLERRFQASDFVPERVGGNDYALAAEICVEVMAQINEAHKYIDKADIKIRAYLTALKDIK